MHVCIDGASFSEDFVFYEVILVEDQLSWNQNDKSIRYLNTAC